MGDLMLFLMINLTGAERLLISHDAFILLAASIDVEQYAPVGIVFINALSGCATTHTNRSLDAQGDGF